MRGLCLRTEAEELQPFQRKLDAASGDAGDDWLTAAVCVIPWLMEILAEAQARGTSVKGQLIWPAPQATGTL